MTFEEIWAFTDTIPGSFTQLSAEKLYEQVRHVPKNGIIVEVGVDQGRSASVILAAMPRSATFALVDSWVGILIDNKTKVEKLIKRYPRMSTLLVHGTSVGTADGMPDTRIDLIHLDADHYEGGIDKDCIAWLPKVKSGGVACFHDYGATFPAVTASVDQYTVGWEDLGNWDGLAIRRKP